MPSAEAPAAGLRPVLLAWALVATVTGLPYLHASFAPPAGTTFIGFFYFVDDSYNYLSYVRQAEEGSLLFENRLLLEKHPATLVNLEWWLVGRMSALLGGRPILAYRLFGLVAALALLAGADRWLRAGGLPDSHRLPALLLVAFGGGLGGILWRTGRLPLADALDLRMGFYPFVEMLANPHFVAGTALLLWSLWAYLRAQGVAGHLRAWGLGTVLGLVRPYDLVLLAGIRTGLVLLGFARRDWRRQIAPLLGLGPVALYNYWVFYGSRTFATFQLGNVFPGIVPFAWALGPALLLASAAARSPIPDPESGRARLHLLVWPALASLVIAINPVTFSLQFLVGIGFPLLALGAFGLARRPPWVTLVVAVAMASTPAVALGLVTSPNPRWFVSPERMETARALRASCRPGEWALAPPDIGLYVGGLTSCKPYVSHPAAPGFAERADATLFFYEGASPVERAEMLDRLCIAHVALPGDPGEAPRAWLGEATPFRRAARVGSGRGRISLYARGFPPGCLPADSR